MKSESTLELWHWFLAFDAKDEIQSKLQRAT